MNNATHNRVYPARPSEVKMLGHSLVDQLLEVEDRLHGPEQFQAKRKVIDHFARKEPDLYPFFAAGVISPYQLLVRVQKAFQTQSDVEFEGNVASKSDAVSMLKRYLPNLQHLHDNQLYTAADTFKELGAAVAIGVVATGITEGIGREMVSNPFLSMEMALTETLTVAAVIFLYFILRRNRNIFHKAPWDSAIYLQANLRETNPDNWESVTWNAMQNTFSPSKGFTILKSRPHYEALDEQYSQPSKGF